MNPIETAQFYALAQEVDKRMTPLSTAGARLWARILKDVPFREAEEILFHLYQSRHNSVLQPGDVVEAWDEVKAERKKIVEAINSIDRYVLIESDPGVLAEKFERRRELLGLLPAHVVEYAGIGKPQLNPPPKYPRREVESRPLVLGHIVKKV